MTHPHVDLLHSADSIFDNDHRTTNSTSIRSDVNSLLLVVDVDTDEFRDFSSPTKETELGNETRTRSGQPKYVSVEVDDEVPFGVNLRPIEDIDIWKRKGVKDESASLSQCQRKETEEDAPSTPIKKHIFQIGSSSTSVVICVMSAKFLTNPQASPSGVSLGQSIPH